MCILICGYGSDHATRKELDNSCANNPDGFGYALLMESGEIIKRVGMKRHAVIESYLAKVDRPGVVANMFHARIGTSGGHNKRNCHPFNIPGESAVLAHNGILPVPVKVNSLLSDTGIFATEMIPEMGGTDIFANPKNRDLLENWARGNKIAILSPSKLIGPLLILNEREGNWIDRVWFSNDSYEADYYSWQSWRYDPKASLLDAYETFNHGDVCDYCETALRDEDNGVCQTCGMCVYCDRAVWDTDHYCDYDHADSDYDEMTVSA